MLCLLPILLKLTIAGGTRGSFSLGVSPAQVNRVLNADYLLCYRGSAPDFNPAALNTPRPSCSRSRSARSLQQWRKTLAVEDKLLDPLLCCFQEGFSPDRIWIPS